MHLRILAAISVAGALLSGCASDGEVGNIFQRKTTWTDFVSGGDIKAACVPGAANRYRAVYNANRADQVRIYDVATNAGGGVLRTRVLEHAISQNSTIWPLEKNTLLDPSDNSTPLPVADVAQIEKLFATDGLAAPAPVGRRLFSGSYFWLVSGCVNGQFHFNAWEYPDDSFKGLNFPNMLFARDDDPVKIVFPRGDERITELNLRDVNFERSGFNHYDFIVQSDGVSMGASYRNRDKF
ncbi:hypothetical protein [Aestuariispira insulae]|uniref:Lipoprotein n=1 Tax=Aestuariispira insulae TaxID=1461337 RepID=A0A3D9HWX7_9PROT|nr:hypothetical protein [Aestuariispira insulae]RED53910.1 hypothetical protein DFP90_101709 [Aestuariispira insulae]